MSPEELIQLMRTCSLANVRAELEALQNVKGERRSASEQYPRDVFYRAFTEFYQRAAARPK